MGKMWMEDWRKNPRMVSIMKLAIENIGKLTENKTWFHSRDILPPGLLQNYRSHVMRVLMSEGICILRGKNKRVYEIKRNKFEELKKELRGGNSFFLDFCLHAPHQFPPLSYDSKTELIKENAYEVKK